MFAPSSVVPSSGGSFLRTFILVVKVGIELVIHIEDSRRVVFCGMLIHSAINLSHLAFTIYVYSPLDNVSYFGRLHVD